MSGWDDFESAGIATADDWSGFEQPDPLEVKGHVFKEVAKQDLLQAGARGMFGQDFGALVDPLNIGGNIRSVGAQVGNRLSALATRAIPGFLQTTGDPTVQQETRVTADDNERWAKAYEQAAEELTPTLKYPARMARGTAASLLPAAALARTTGSSSAPIALGTAQTASSSLQEARDAGLPENQARWHAARQALWEALPEIIANRLLGGTESALARQGAIKGLKTTAKEATKTLAGEVGGELATTALQQTDAALSGVDPHAMDNMLPALRDAAVQAALGAGVVEAPNAAQSAMRSSEVAKQREAGRPAQPEVSRDTVAEVLKVARESGHHAPIEALATNDQPSRSDWTNAGLPAELGKSGETRRKFTQELRGILNTEQLTGAPVAEPLPVDDSGLRLDKGRLADVAAQEPPPPEDTRPPQQPDVAFGADWTPMPADAPQLAIPGLEIYHSRSGTAYARRAQGPPFQQAMDTRQTQLGQMTMGELNQEGSRYGLKKSQSGKAKKIAAILDIEEQRALGNAQPESVPPGQAPAAEQPAAAQSQEPTQPPEALPDYEEFAATQKYSVRKQPDGTFRGVVSGPFGEYFPKANEREAAKREAFDALTAGQPVVGFATAQGSTYEVNGNSTTRNKSKHALHDAKDVGLKKPSDRTLFVSPLDAQRIGMHNSLNKEAKPTILIQGDKALLLSWNEKQNRWGRDGEAIQLSDKPQIGMAPLELWGEKPADLNGVKGTVPSNNHPGNTITEIRHAGRVRSDESQVSQAGNVEEGGRAEGGPNLQRQAQEGPAASDAVRNLGDLPQGEQSRVATKPQKQSPITITDAKPKTGRKLVTRKQVVAAFPQAQIDDIPGGWRVHAGQSYIDVQQVHEVKIDWDALEKQQGRQFSAEDRKKVAAAGKFGFRLDDGTVHDGLGLIQLAEGMANDGTVRHEALHFARRAGLLSDAEYKRLADKFYDRSKPETVEEQIAKARESWTDPEARTIWNRIQQWLRNVLASIGIDQRSGHDIFRAMETGNFWQRPGVNAREAEAMQVARERDAFQVEQPNPVAEQLRTAIAQGPVQIKTDKWTYRVKGLTPDGKIRTTTGQLLPLEPLAEGKWQIVAGGATTTPEKAMAETEAASPGTYQVTNREDLANPGETQAVRNLVDTVDETRNTEGQPQIRPDAEVQAEAETRLAADYEGERVRLLNTAKQGGQLLDTDTVIAKAIVNRDGMEAVVSGNPQALVDAMALIDAYRRTGTEQGRAFRQRRDPVETPAQRMQRGIVEAALEPPAADREKINKATAAGDYAEAERIRKAWADKFDGLKKRLKELGVDLDNLNKLGYSPVKEAKALGAISAAKATWNDVLYEYWRNAILSSVRTQAANMLGNIIHPFWHYTVERPTEAVLNKAIGRKEGAQLGEFAHLFDASRGAMSRAARNFWLSFQTEMPQFDREVGRAGQFKHESPNVAIPGKTGRVVRLPQRLMLAADEFSKSLLATMEVGARAYRIAQAEGKSGAALDQRIKELTDDIESPAWDAAYDHTLSMVFQQKGGPLAQQAKQVGLSLRRTSIGKWFLPFVTTPVNILETGIHKSPMGMFTNLMPKMINNLRAGKPAMSGLTPAAAQQVIAWAALAGIWALIPDDDEDRLITGTNKNADPRREKIGPPPLSVRIGGTWYSYARIEPFATSLGLAVDFIDALRSGEPTTTITSPIESLAKQARDKTFLEGVGSLMEVLESGLDPEEVLKKGSNFAASWIPNLIRTGARSLDEQVPQRGIWGEGADRTERILARGLQQGELLPASVTGETGRYDIWGRPLETSRSPVPGTDIAYRNIVPVDTRKASDFIGDRMIENYNAKHRDDERKFTQADRAITKDGKRTFLTDQQYEDYARVSGLIGRKLVESAGFTNAKNPTPEDMDRLHKLVLDARDITRDALAAGKLDDSDHGISVLAASDHLRHLGYPMPQSLPKAQKDKGVSWQAFKADWQARTASAKKYLSENGISRGEALAAFDKLVVGLEADTRRRQRGVLLSRLSAKD